MISQGDDLAYRYVSGGEADLIKRNGGVVPNVDIHGNPKNVFTSPNKYDSIADAEKGLQIGSLNPSGPTASPTHRVTYQRSSVTYTYAGSVEGGTGIEMITYEEINILSIDELAPY